MELETKKLCGNLPVIWQCERELEHFIAEHDAWKEDDFTETDRVAIRTKFPDSKYIIVKHESRKKWYDKFMEGGIDTAIRPPEMRYGRLTVYPEGKMLQTIIEEPGLYVSPPPFRYDQGVLIAVKPSELAVSSEASTCRTPECGLYYRKDGLIRNATIPPHRVLGLYDWVPKAEEYWRYGGRHSSSDWHWQFIPNPKALKNPAMKRIIDCMTENPPNDNNLLKWMGC